MYEDVEEGECSKMVEEEEEKEKQETGKRQKDKRIDKGERKEEKGRKRGEMEGNPQEKILQNFLQKILQKIMQKLPNFCRKLYRIFSYGNRKIIKGGVKTSKKEKIREWVRERLESKETKVVEF